MAESALAKVFDATTLADLADRRAELALGANMFYI
jgi:hypothetical protein